MTMTAEQTAIAKKIETDIFFFKLRERERRREKEREKEMLICTDRIIDQSRDQYPGFFVRIIR